MAAGVAGLGMEEDTVLNVIAMSSIHPDNVITNKFKIIWKTCYSFHFLKTDMSIFSRV